MVEFRATRSDRSRDLARAIEQTGFYPEVVADAVDSAVAGEEVVAFHVHHEPTFDHDEVRRHLTVVVLTPVRLVVAHTDDHAPDDLLPEPYTTTSTETVALAEVKSVVVNRYVAQPDGGARGVRPEVREVVLTVGWGMVSRVELEPAVCPDPDCTADHGFSGTVSGEDFSIRASVAADGPQAVPSLLTFAEQLQRLTRRG